MTVIALPPVGRIETLTYIDTGSGDLLSHHIAVQYSAPGQSDALHALVMPMKEALFLLHLLEKLSAQEKFERKDWPAPGS